MLHVDLHVPRLPVSDCGGNNTHWIDAQAQVQIGRIADPTNTN